MMAQQTPTKQEPMPLEKAPERKDQIVTFYGLSVPRSILESCQFFRNYPLPAQSGVAA